MVKMKYSWKSTIKMKRSCKKFVKFVSEKRIMKKKYVSKCVTMCAFFSSKDKLR